MKYRVLKGELVIDGRSPDGDTVGFRLDPERLGDWVWPGARMGRFPKLNRGGVANVRFEAIDALELHFTVQGVWPQVTSHQDLELARGARNEMLALCGFDVSRLQEDEGCTLHDPDEQAKAAVVAYREIDPYGRIVGFVFGPEDAPPLSTTQKPEVFLSPEVLLRSINAELLREGWVFPTYYGGLDHGARDALSSSFARARSNGIGVWGRHEDSVILPRKPTIEEIESLMLMPKIYRRLVTHIARNGAVSNFVASLSDDVVVDTVHTRLCDLGAFVDVDGPLPATAEQRTPDRVPYRLRLTRGPEQLVFMPG